MREITGSAAIAGSPRPGATGRDVISSGRGVAGQPAHGWDKNIGVHAESV